MVKSERRIIAVIGLVAIGAIIGLTSCDKDTPAGPDDGLHTEGGYITGPGEDDEFTLDTEYSPRERT